MKRLKNVTEQLENEAKQNVQGFDHTELCYNSIFHLLNDNGVFYNAANAVLKTTKPKDVKIKMESFKYGYVKENDGSIYPKVDLMISIIDDEIENFVFTVTPFTATMEYIDMFDVPYGNCDDELTRIWQTIMKGIFKDKWIEAFKQYCYNVRIRRLIEIEKNARNERLKNQEIYDDNINSIL